MSVDSNWRALYPFTSRELNLDGHRYHYLDEGNSNTAATLLLVHGNPTWSFHWRKLIAAWRDKYRVIAPDHVGCGLSHKPADYRYDLSRHIENLSRLILELDLSHITLLVHDWGGPIGLGTAATMPERFSRFVALNTAAFPSRRMPWRIRACRTPLLGRLMVQGLNAFVRAALRMAVHNPRRITPAIRAGYLAPYDTWGNRRAIQSFVEDIPMSPSHRSYEKLLEIRHGLDQFQNHPWLFIWGMRDWCFTPHFLDRFLEIIPAADVHRLAEVGHWVAEEADEDVVTLVEEFLRSGAVSDESN